MKLRCLNKMVEEGKKIGFKKDFTKKASLEYINHYMDLTKETMEKSPKAQQVGISEKNRKVNHLSFSITPIISCGKECDNCHKYCYDMKSYVQYRDTRHARNRNYLLSQRSDFVENMVNELKYLDVRHFRLHVGGDFYNQEYLNKWYEIIRRVKNIKFYAFTKKYDALDLATNKPSNLILIGSIDDFQNTKEERDLAKSKGLDKVARVTKDGYLIETEIKAKGGFNCEGGVGKEIGCGRGCDKCFKDKRFTTINFEIH